MKFSSCKWDVIGNASTTVLNDVQWTDNVIKRRIMLVGYIKLYYIQSEVSYVLKNNKFLYFIT